MPTVFEIKKSIEIEVLKSNGKNHLVLSLYMFSTWLNSEVKKKGRNISDSNCVCLCMCVCVRKLKGEEKIQKYSRKRLIIQEWNY